MAGLRLAKALLAAIVAAQPLIASADSLDATIDTRVTVQSGCRLTTEPLAFGIVNINSVQVDATTPVRLRCGPGIPFSVAIDNGRHFNGMRRMFAGNGNLYVPYQIYRDPARTLVWSTGINQVVGVTPPGGEVVLTAYGRVPDTRRPARPYVDQVTVTVNF